MSRGHMICSPFAMGLLIIEKDVSTIGLEEVGLIQPAEENRLVDPDIPGAQRPNDAFVGGRRARRDQCRPDGPDPQETPAAVAVVTPKTA